MDKDLIIYLVPNLFSFIAIIISIINIFINNRISKRNIDRVYFDSIYKEFMIKKIPNARNKIMLTKEVVISGTKELNMELQKLFVSSIYYKHTDIKFYNSIKEKCIDIQNILCDYSDKKVTTLVYEDSFLKLINEKLDDLYRLLNKKMTK